MLRSRRVWAAVVVMACAPRGVMAGELGPPSVELGRELFLHEWLSHDPRSHGGDGLGPVYNATSCAACHSQGGPGGSGGVDQNVLLITAMLKAKTPRARSGRHPTRRGGTLLPPPDVADPGLIRFHAGFRDGPTIVLHRHGADTRPELRETLLVRELGFTARSGPTPAPRTAADALEVLGKLISEGQALDLLREPDAGSPEYQGIQRHVLRFAERNPPPLFGLGRIDELPERDLEKTAAQEPPSIRGRVHEIEHGLVAKFGWKAQTATLDEFVQVACAGELGLEVPGHHQAVAPDGPVRPGGLDLNEVECRSIAAYVASLPSPTRAPGSEADPNVRAGERLFREVGCAVCHAPSVGDLNGIYSDLLLHDLGAALGSEGAYYGAVTARGRDPRAARSREWRTAPLWGYRDSAPYLHNGRARDLDEVIALHLGQADRSRRAYLGLDRADRGKIELFLESMVAPLTHKPPPHIASQLESKLRASASLAAQGRNPEAKALYQEIVAAAPGTTQGVEARFRIDAMGLEAPRDPREKKVSSHRSARAER